MKKIVFLIISVFILSIFNIVQSNSIELVNNTWTLSIWSISEKQEISYTYYYGEWCSHCYKVDKYLVSVDWYNKLGIIKKEVYFNDESRKDMLNDGKRLWLDEKDIWVPFLIVNNNWEEKFFKWDKTIIEYFIPILGEAPKNNNKTIILAILWVLAILLPVFLIKLTKNN